VLLTDGQFRIQTQWDINLTKTEKDPSRLQVEILLQIPSGDF
jgi:hypothetical protein